MATLRQYFDTDFNVLLSSHKTATLTSGSNSTEIVLKLHLDFDAGTKFVSCYLPPFPNVLSACLAILNSVDTALTLADGLAIHTGFPGEEGFTSSELSFSGRLFIYSENELSETEKQQVKEVAKTRGVVLKFRTPKFADERSHFEKPQAFICHDSRDKETVRQIAIGLIRLRCPVWYDEYSLNVGDSLRARIEDGIKTCKKCVLILSPNFLSNNRWTKKEFDSIFTREIVEEDRVMLPVWMNVTHEEVYQYSPSLANTVAAQLSAGVDVVCQQLYRALSISNRPIPGDRKA